MGHIDLATGHVREWEGAVRASQVPAGPGARGRDDDCMGGDLGCRLHALLRLQRRRWMEANGNERENERKRGAVANWLL